MEEVSTILKLLNIEKYQEEVEVNNGAFIPKGKKVLKYYGSNFLEVVDLETQAYYTMEYLHFRRLFRVMGFKEKLQKRTEGLILAEQYVIIDFDKLQVATKNFPVIKSPIGAYLSHAADSYSEIIEQLIDEDPSNLNLNQ